MSDAGQPAPQHHGQFGGIGGGWGTWIRTRTNGVRVRSSTVKLSPTVAPQAALSGAFRDDTVCRVAGAAAVARSIDAPAGSVYPPPRSFHRHRVTPRKSGRHGRAASPLGRDVPCLPRGPFSAAARMLDGGSAASRPRQRQVSTGGDWKRPALKSVPRREVAPPSRSGFRLSARPPATAHGGLCRMHRPQRSFRIRTRPADVRRPAGRRAGSAGLISRHPRRHRAAPHPGHLTVVLNMAPRTKGA